MKLTKFELLLISIPVIAAISLSILLQNKTIKIEDFWNNLTYFLFAGIFIPTATFIKLRRSHNQAKDEKRYNAKKLNDEVFRKMMCISSLEYFNYFKNHFGLCITEKPEKLNIRDFFHFYLKPENNEEIKTIEKDFTPIEKAIPTLEVGEKYLEKNYEVIYSEWVKIKEELDKINNQKLSFLKKISSKIKKDLKKEFKSEPKSLLNPFGDDWAYFEEFVLLALPLLFRNHSTIKLEIDEIENQHYINYNGLRLIGFNKLPKRAMEQIEFIFQNIITNYNLSSENGNFYVSLYEINVKLLKFSKDIETKVVNDIDNLF